MKDKEKNESAVLLGRRGGEATKKKYGVEHFKKIGSIKWKKDGKEKHRSDSNN